jgi:hypothetical protein
MLNGWDQRRWYDDEESTEPSSKGGLSDKSSNRAIEKIPDHFAWLTETKDASSVATISQVVVSSA